MQMTLERSDSQFDVAKSVSVERFLEMYSVSQSRIYAYILSFIPHHADADDVLQEVITLMWRKFDKFEPGTDFLAWALGVARFKIMEHRRSSKTTVQFNDDVIQTIETEGVFEITQRNDRNDALRDCLNKLSQNDRMLISLKYNEEIPVKEIALRINWSVIAVYRTLARIHENLLVCIRRTLMVKD